MATELPEPLQWVLLLLAGTRWPEQDEDQLRDMADHWRKAATALQDASHAADAAVKQALEGQQGAAADALTKHWADYTVGKGTDQDPGYLPSTIAACNGMGDMLEGMANSAETAKISIIAQLGILAFELATAEAEAPVTAGASLVEVPVMVQTTRQVVMDFLKTLLKEALQHALKQAVQMAAINLLAQSIELAEGHRKSIDMKEVGQNALGGAVAGATGHLLGKGIGAAGEKLGLGGLMGTTGGKMLTGAAVGVGTDALTQEITTGHVDTGSLLGSGLSGGAGAGLHAGAAAARDHFREPTAPPPEGALGGGGAGGDHAAPPTFTPSTSTDHASGGSGDSYHGPSADTPAPDHTGGSSDTPTSTGVTGLTPFGSNRPSAGESAGGSGHDSSAPAPDPVSAGTGHGSGDEKLSYLDTGDGTVYPDGTTGLSTHEPAPEPTHEPAPSEHAPEGASSGGSVHEDSAPAPEPASGHMPGEGSTGTGGEGHGNGEERLRYLDTGDKTVYPDGTTGLSSHDSSAPPPEPAPTHQGETLNPGGDTVPSHQSEAAPVHDQQSVTAAPPHEAAPQPVASENRPAPSEPAFAGGGGGGGGGGSAPAASHSSPDLAGGGHSTGNTPMPDTHLAGLGNTTHLDGTRVASGPAPTRPAPGDRVPGSPDDVQAPPSGTDAPASATNSANGANSGAVPPQMGAMPHMPGGSAPHAAPTSHSTAAPPQAAPKPARGSSFVTAPGTGGLKLGPIRPRPETHAPSPEPSSQTPHSGSPRNDQPHNGKTSPGETPHGDTAPKDGTAAPHHEDTEHNPTAQPQPHRPATGDRPIGGEGGLEEPSELDVARINGAVPHNEDGTPQRHPDPNEGNWLAAINGEPPHGPGRNNNCVDATLAVLDTFHGDPTPAAARTPDHDANGHPSDLGERAGRDRVEKNLGAKFSDLGNGPAAFHRLEETLHKNGHGSSAAITTIDADGRSHSWNALNHNGKITYVDGQTGKHSDQPFHEGNNGVFAIPLDPNRHPTTPVPHTDPNHNPADDRRAPERPGMDAGGLETEGVDAEDAAASGRAERSDAARFQRFLENGGSRVRIPDGTQFMFSKGIHFKKLPNVARPVRVTSEESVTAAMGEGAILERKNSEQEWENSGLPSYEFPIRAGGDDAGEGAATSDPAAGSSTAGPSVAKPTVKTKSNKKLDLTMEFHKENPYGFAHYSMRTIAKNDHHLTIDNALATLGSTIAGQGREGVLPLGEFITTRADHVDAQDKRDAENEKPGKGKAVVGKSGKAKAEEDLWNKATFGKQSQSHGFSRIDNLHFYPARNESGVTLAEFMKFTDTSLDRLGLEADSRTKMKQSVDFLAQRLTSAAKIKAPKDREADVLYMAGDNKKGGVVEVMTYAVQMTLHNNARAVPAALEAMVRDHDDTGIQLDEHSFGEIKESLVPRGPRTPEDSVKIAKIEDDMRKNGWKTKNGETLDPVKKAIIAQYRDDVMDWIRNP
ncbi:hypothetical protein GCM10009760_55720 [Kitasatospora kazusensis]|uniref:Papain fold toxin 1 (Glutamine deamidase) of polymorphic toxin system n=1 Tax=Kitasatospora kazusensis TaxID=407974 RepID=A0ABP5M256_9ACTN